MIHGHPTITSFKGGRYFHCESWDALYSTLATLPALESIHLEQTAPDFEPALAHPESLTELLRAPSLRSVCFYDFAFTPALCQATANALMEGTVITKLDFKYCSLFAEGGAVMMANGLSRNTSVSQINVTSPSDQTLFDALATALPSNSTLRRLDLYVEGIDDHKYDWSPVLWGLGQNTGLKNVSLHEIGSMNESLCTAMKDGLGMNATIESLKLSFFFLTNDQVVTLCDTGTEFLSP